ncbi:MAG: hypothetical protein V7L25_05710 [Nostoc sp.]|uniref:hypothetical protein n=1 Tax=Nostoc sp. TaxID=1180 RepID=UPI002FF2D8B5
MATGRFKAVLLQKAKDTVIKPQCMGQLLEELLKRESIGAREFAKDMDLAMKD